MDFILLIMWEITIGLFWGWLYIEVKHKSKTQQFPHLSWTSLFVKNSVFYFFLMLIPFGEKLFLNIADGLKINGVVLALLIMILITHFLILKLYLKVLILDAKIRNIDQNCALKKGDKR